jgi:hypothetical protein
LRFRKGGFSVYISGTPWSEDFMRQYAEALDGVNVRPSIIGASRTVAGTVDALKISARNMAHCRSIASAGTSASCC